MIYLTKHNTVLLMLAPEMQYFIGQKTSRLPIWGEYFWPWTSGFLMSIVKRDKQNLLHIFFFKEL